MLNDTLRRSVDKHFSSRVLSFHDDTLTYGDLYRRACQLANLLLEAGVRPGDRVAFLGNSGVSSFDEFSACALGSFVRSPLYMQDTAERHAYMLRRVQAAALVVDGPAWLTLRDTLTAEEVDQFRTILVKGDAPAAADLQSYEEALQQASTDDPRIPETDTATYVVRFSAGTTGLPKPIAHSRRAYFTGNTQVLSCTPPLESDDVYLAVSPYSHASGNLVWPFLAAGASHVAMDGRFDPDEALRLIRDHDCTTLFLVPTMIQRLLNSDQSTRENLSSIRRVLYGAAPIPRALVREALQLFRSTLCQLYGQSEMVPLTCLSPEDHKDDQEGETGKLGTAGRPISSTAIRIESPEGQILETGETGEIVGHSPGMMDGIFGDPEATAKRFTEDGWLRTGDVGWIDEDGYLHVVDRIDDMIISGGFNISPFEIEDALGSHEAVDEAVVFGVPHESWGQAPMAVVRLKPGHHASQEALIDWCRSKVGKMKKPSSIVITKEPLPTNAAGKLLRREAKKQYTQIVED